MQISPILKKYGIVITRGGGKVVRRETCCKSGGGQYKTIFSQLRESRIQA